MFRSRLFGFVVITLWLLAFVCAHGAVSEQLVWSAVMEVKELTRNVLMKAQGKHSDAEGIKDKVESRKTRAEGAANDAEKAANGNANAAAFAVKAKNEFNACLSEYSSAKQKAREAFDTTEMLLGKARQLKNNAQNIRVTSSASEQEYTKQSESAAELKNETEELEKGITAAEGLIGSAKVKLWTLEAHAERAVVAKYQVDAIVKVLEIENMLHTADDGIKIIEQKREEVYSTVNEIRAIIINLSHEESMGNRGYLTNAEGDLRIISGFVNEVKEIKKELVRHKGYADTTLQEMQQQTEERQANNELATLKYHTKNAATALEKITVKLSASEIHAGNAKKRKVGLLRSLARNGNNQNGQNGNSAEITQKPTDVRTIKQENKKTEQTVENTQEQSVQSDPTQTADKGNEESFNNNPKPFVKSEPLQPAHQDTEKTVENTQQQSVQSDPTQTAEKGNEESFNNYPEPFVKSESPQPENQGTAKTVENRAKQSVKDKLKGFVNNEELSTSDVINDTAKTATFSLPLSLLVFYALHGRY